MAEHGAEILSYGRRGSRATCLCGWRGGLWSTGYGASQDFAEHLRKSTPYPTTAATTEETP